MRPEKKDGKKPSKRSLVGMRRMTDQSIYVDERSVTEVHSGQEELAKRLCRKIESGEVSEPNDLPIDSWKGFPRDDVEWIEEKEEDQRMVPVKEIKGTDQLNTERLDGYRMIKALMTLGMGDYFKRPDHPPHLMHVEGDGYYVGSDGNHRTMSHKCLGIKQMYAKVTYYRKIPEKSVEMIRNGEKEFPEKAEVHMGVDKDA